METRPKSGVPESGRQRRIKKEEVRRRILAAAYGVFAERGYEGASLERVAEAAGFSKGAVYSNFASKDELFYELIAARIDERAEAVQASAAKRAVAAEKASRSAPAARPSKPEAAETTARLAGRELREMGAADPGWQTLFIEFWLRCARSEELRIKLAERRAVMRAKIAESIEAQARASGRSMNGGQALDLATTVLALSNGLGIEGLIDPTAVRSELFGEILAKLVASPADTTAPGSAGGTRTSGRPRPRTR